MHIFYIIFITGLLLFTLPFHLLISIIILLFYGRPVLFLQKRIGKNGKPFNIIKFRTMYVGAEKLQSRYKNLNEADGPVFKIHNDPRLTPVGRFLRHVGLDELPQLFNVLNGEMSLFGPRPLPVSEARKLALWQKKRHQIKPGIISPWIVNGYHSQSFNDWMKSDLLYISQKSFFFDVKLFYKSLVLLTRFFLREIFTVLGKYN